MRRQIFRIVVVVLLAASAAAGVAAPAGAQPVCGDGLYEYAGYAGLSATRGVSATISQAGPLAVRRGHVAGWIGIVDPRSSDAWLQVGLSALPGASESAIYYEYAVPGSPPVYRQVRAGVSVAEPHRVALLEQPSRPGWWLVWIDGRQAGAPVHLRGSHGRWRVQALGESWAGNASGPCNAYSYAFEDFSVLPSPGSRAGELGTVLSDPHYIVAQVSTTGFVVTSFGTASFRVGQMKTPQAPPQRPSPHAHAQ